MPKYVVERKLPGAGSFTPDVLQSISQKSCVVLDELGDVQWLESYVTTDKLYCVFIAPDAARVLEHAQRGGLPASSVARVSAVIDPATAEG